jgi:two-component system response regulator MtrA
MSRVMIIDDDRTMLSLLKILLEMEGFEVVGAPRHDAILSSVRTEKPDLVLMDVFLPGVDGMEVLSQMRASPDLAEARVLMTSGMDLGDQCLAAGANGFLLKPYTPEQLISMINENLGPDGPSRPPAGIERLTK